MNELEFLAAVPLYRAAWVRKVRSRLTRRNKIGAAESAQDIVQQAIAELTAFDAQRGAPRYEALQGPADITKRIEYRLRDFLDHDRVEALLEIEEGDDREAHRFKRGKTTTAWVMTETDEYLRQVDIKDALNALTHEQRYVAAMVLVEGHTEEDVAVRLRVGRKKVRGLLEKAKAQLRDLLSDYGGA
jgi:DNA-directed RNA polymerase specialized sigma24 family protein